MCRSKRSTDVSTPATTPKTRNSRSSRSSFKSKSSSSNSINFNNADYTTNSALNFSYKSSIKRGNSLSSFKESLPESPHVYNLSEICSATNNFLAKKFSSSSSSSAWRSTIRGKDVIIFQRKLRRSLELQQLCEQLSVICRSHHSSIIKLLGACVSGNYVYLVYEYVLGANLADCLRNPRNPNFTVLSTWLSRMQVAADLAHGLDYIHHFSGLNSNVIHNHIKSTSILVSEDNSGSLCARICHFGTAELCGEVIENENGEVKKIEGTRGYMAPEFKASGVATHKSDVFAFGVVLLELFSGEEALGFVVDERSGACKRVSVIEKASEAAAGGIAGVRSWFDRRLKDSYPVEVAEKMMLLGLQCVDKNPEKRPDMRGVTGLVSKLYLESKSWAETIGLPTDFSVTMVPR